MHQPTLTQIRSAVLPSTFDERFTHYRRPYFSLLQKQLIALLITATAGFLLAFEMGWIEYFF